MTFYIFFVWQTYLFLKMPMKWQVAVMNILQCLVGNGESYGLTLQDYTIFFIQLNNVDKFKKIRCCHIMLIPQAQGGIIQGIPQLLFQFQQFCEGQVFGYS